jgi:hypothetical protein
MGNADALHLIISHGIQDPVSRNIDVSLFPHLVLGGRWVFEGVELGTGLGGDNYTKDGMKPDAPI